MQSINDKFLPILGDVALAKVGQLVIENLSTRINSVYGELVLLRRFLDLDTPEEAANGGSSTPLPDGSSRARTNDDSECVSFYSAKNCRLLLT